MHNDVKYKKTIRKMHDLCILTYNFVLSIPYIESLGDLLFWILNLNWSTLHGEVIQIMRVIVFKMQLYFICIC